MGNPIICMNLLEKTSDYAIYVYGTDPEHLDGKIKISINNPRENIEILKESAIGHSDTLLACSKLARTIEQGVVPERICRAS